ncbi:MAG: hypothetical protein H8E72_09745, partial [Candidatus Marinimicrobia bacterium]|nr:hypothetical protein [Candidatus Neomarinimicrobiota bacterium]
MKKVLFLISLSFTIAISFANEFSLVSKNQHLKIVKFVSSEIDLVEKDGYARLTNPELGSTVENGLPELPTYSTFFHMERGITYNVEFEVISSHIIENIEIYPYQGEPEVDVIRPFLKNVDFYNSKSKYPEVNLTLSEPMIMRDMELGQLTFIPYEYNAQAKQLIIYDDVNINIIQSGQRDVDIDFPQKRSYLFEPFYEDFIVDYEPLTTREDYQPATVMYICGGNSVSHPYVQQLIDWRKRQGYIVYTVSTSETGTSATSIKNYLVDAFNSLENPPEIVGLIGDTGGTYSIGYNTYNYDGYSGATDVEYSYLSGNDFLPEVFIGRISVNSSSDISNLINKTLTYEKALNQGDWWYERAAMVADPSSSGVSTMTTLQYIENIMENFGVTDIRTNYGNGNYDNWVEGQFDDGILYYNYRGYYGSSGIGQSGLNSGIYTPFASTVTCGTGDFEGTSESENFVRAGSFSDPQGAVACVGVATIGTHTAYNNIVHMGMYEGIFSKGMYHAGASLANGKLALLRTYPTNPSNSVSRFSAWPNLIGDPALHLWIDKPHEFTIDSPTHLPASETSVDVNVTNENGEVVEDARVTVILGDNYFSSYTDENGDATVNWTGLTLDEIEITVFKKDFRLGETVVSLGQVSGPAIFIDNTRSTIDDMDTGNGNMQINAGEIFQLNIPIINYGSEGATDLTLRLTHNNEKVNIVDPIQEIVSIQSDEEITITYLISLENSVYEAEDLQLQLNISDALENEWNLSIPAYVYAPKLEGMCQTESGSVSLFPGEESKVDLRFKNTGSVELENIQITFNDESEIAFISNPLIIESFNANSEIIISDVSLLPSSHIMNGTLVSVEFSFTSENGFSGSDYITFEVGQRDEGDPMGPDEHGYYIYDSGDISYSAAPIYDWIEIVGNGGTNFNFSDGGDGTYNDTSTDVVQLPFTFKFYGIDYDEVTVSTNGWISFGDHEMAAFRNYSVPGAGGPSPMVAAFWDDLTTDSGGDVYHLITDEYVIIQWNEMRIHDHGSQENTLQLLLYNPEYTFAPTGDGEIKIQYKEFNNISDGDYYGYTPLHGCYSTVGIENHLGNIGLEYTFDDDYPTEAMELSDNTAVFITTTPPEALPAPALEYSSENFSFQLQLDESDTQELVISNIGEAESVLNYYVSSSYPELESPFSVTGGGPDEFGYFWSDSDIDSSLDYEWIDISADGTLIEFTSNDVGVGGFEIGFPFSFYGVEYSEFLVNPNGWVGFGNDNDEWHNGNLPYENGPTAAVMGLWDDLNPENLGCNESCVGEVSYHSDGERLVVWFNNVAHWVTDEFQNTSYDFQIVIYSNGEIQINYSSLSGGFSATVGIQNENATSYLQVDQYIGNYFHNELSIYFKNREYVDWLSISSDNLAGNILEGESILVQIQADASGLFEGEYHGYVNIMPYTMPSVQIPISLTVGGGMVSGDVNNDGLLNVLDIVQIVNFVLGNLEFNDSQISAADVNADGLVNVLDIVTLVNMILTF